MALTTVTVTFDAAQILGTDFDSRRTRVRVYTNVENQTLIDTAANLIRMGDETVTIADDGTGSFSTWAPGADGNPISWQTYVAFDYPRTGARDRVTRIFGPYTITANANLADLEEEQAVPAEYLTTVTETLDAYIATATSTLGGYATAALGYRNEAEGFRDETEAALADAELITGITGEDTAIAFLLGNEGSATYVATRAMVPVTTDGAMNGDAAIYDSVTGKFKPASVPVSPLSVPIGAWKAITDGRAFVTGFAAAVNIVTGGNLVVTVDGLVPLTIALATSDTPAQVVTKINTAAFGCITASLVSSAVRITTRTSGATGSVTITSGTGTVLDNLKFHATQTATGGMSSLTTTNTDMTGLLKVGVPATLMSTAAIVTIVTGGDLVLTVNGATVTTTFTNGDTAATVVTKLNAALVAASAPASSAQTSNFLRVVSTATGASQNITVVSGTGTVLSNLSLTAAQSATGTGLDQVYNARFTLPANWEGDSADVILKPMNPSNTLSGNVPLRVTYQFVGNPGDDPSTATKTSLDQTWAAPSGAQWDIYAVNMGTITGLEAGRELNLGLTRRCSNSADTLNGNVAVWSVCLVRS